MAKFRKTFYVSLTVGFILSLLLWLVVVLNGEIVPSGQPGLVGQVHRVQQPGADLARGWFPCKAVTPDAPVGNCEYFKIVPATILINALLYAGLLFIPIYLFRFFSTSLD